MSRVLVFSNKNIDFASAFATALLLSSSLQILENFIPKIPIFPWLRFGLSYLVLLPFILRFGSFYGGALFLARNALVFLFGGQVFSGFIISSLSGIFSLWLLGPFILLLWKYTWIGFIGLGVLFAGIFNVLQLFIVHWIFVPHEGFLFQLAPILIWSVFSGSLIGWGVWHTWDIMERLFLESIDLWKIPIPKKKDTSSSIRRFWQGKGFFDYKVWTSIFIGVLFASLFSSSLYYQGILFSVLFFRDIFWNRTQGVFRLKWTWPFLLYLAWFYLLDSYGVYIIGDWITKEGLEMFLLLSFRMGNAVLLGSLVTWIFWEWWDNSSAFLSSLKQLKPIFYVLPYMPLIFGVSLLEAKRHWKQLWGKKTLKKTLESYLQSVLAGLKEN